MSPVQPIAHICDVHVPDHDKALWGAFLRWCRDTKPKEVVIGGDFLEMESCSKHGGKARLPMLMEDVKAGKKALRELRAACPKAKITYIEGNHETRLTRKVISDAAELDGALDLPTLLDLKSLDIEWVPYGKVVVRGKIGFVHGYLTPKHHAAAHLAKYKRSISYGHTHKPQIHIDGAVDSNGANSVIGAFGQPCMRTLDPEWMNNEPHGWVQGFGVFYPHDDGCFTPFTVLVNRGRFVWNGKTYGKAAA